MNRAWTFGVMICFAVALAPAGSWLKASPQAALPVKDEPHHHLLLENDYTRVYLFALEPHSSALLHLHALPYFAFMLGPADYVNAVQGKPEAHVSVEDAHINWSTGGFAHLVRTDTDTRFYNFTVELMKPQGHPRNRCTRVIADGPLDCPEEAAGRGGAPIPAFETDGVLVESLGLPAGPNYKFESTPAPRLILVMQDSLVDVEEHGGKTKKLKSEEVYWLPGGASAEIYNGGKAKTTGKGRDKRVEEPPLARVYLLGFK